MDSESIDTMPQKARAMENALTGLLKRLPAVLAVAGLLLGPVAAPLRAQSPRPEPADSRVFGLSAAEIDELRRARNDIALFHYGSRYALYVVLGVTIGGYLFALLSWGRTGPTIFGSVLGSSVGIWWFLDEFSGDFLERHTW